PAAHPQASASPAPPKRRTRSRSSSSSMPAAARPWNPPHLRQRSNSLSPLQRIPRVAVVGGGAFGRNHLRVYHELESPYPGELQLTALIEPEAARRTELAAHYNIPAFASLDEALRTGAAP